MLPSDWLKQIQKAYPRRTGGQGWGYVKRRIPELIKKGETFEDLLAGAQQYGDLCRATNEKFVRMARTFYGPDEWWLEDYELPSDGSVELTVDQEAELCGLQRQNGETDEQLMHRIGVAQTNKKYGIG